MQQYVLGWHEDKRMQETTITLDWSRTKLGNMQSRLKQRRQYLHEIEESMTSNNGQLEIQEHKEIINEQNSSTQKQLNRKNKHFNGSQS